MPVPQDTSSSAPSQNAILRVLTTIRQWFDSDYFPEGAQSVRDRPDRFEWRRCLPFAFLHVGCIGAIWTGWSWTAVCVAAVLYFIRMFAITGIYHRYFSHRSYKTSRAFQFFLAVLGNTAVQRGALWWASVHRHHHEHSDDEHDAHSPVQHGFVWAHIGWMTSSKNFPTDYSRIKDLARYPELVFLNRFDLIVPALFAGALAVLGGVLNHFWPSLGTSAGQMVVWGFFISTCFLLHGTLFINSLAHVFGRRRFKTTDTSRNSFILAMITLGEGWHNNHHRFMFSTRQGFYWWELDVTWYILKMLSWMGLIWNLRVVPEHVYEEARTGISSEQEETSSLPELAELPELLKVKPSPTSA